jgi:hypothetical protein
MDDITYSFAPFVVQNAAIAAEPQAFETTGAKN